ncbi:hypothetical protein F5B20DRAFT_224537 [Whalleya microplaca]|nr:hypothetical protein F5B20DRAFT_224537 [Whalleya microplaca]
MKYAAQVAAVVVASTFSALAMAVPLDQRDIEVSLPKRDGLEYHDWVQREVVEGRMAWANGTEQALQLRDLEGRGFTAAVRHVACNTVFGDQPTFEDSKENFCSWASQIEDKFIVHAQAWAIDSICGGDDCRAFWDITFDHLGWFKAGQFGTVCREIFDEIFTRCHGRGGTGDVRVNSGREEVKGTFTIDFIHHPKTSQTCPTKPKPSTACKKEL